MNGKTTDITDDTDISGNQEIEQELTEELKIDRDWPVIFRLRQMACCGTCSQFQPLGRSEKINSTCVERIPRMMILRPLRLLAQALLVDATPRQLAAGFALGMLIGLIPKGNLIAISLMTLFCALRINLAAGTVAIALFAWVGMFLDPISHRLGHFLLTQPALEPYWASLYGLKLMPWTAFNNTVVLGSTLIGLALLAPAYGLSRPVFARLSPRLAEFVRKYHVVQVLHGGEVTGKLA